MSKTTTAATPSGSDSDMLLLKSNLKQLRLPTIGREFEKLARDAASSNQTFEQYLLRLTELEVTTRQSNALQARIKQANLPVEKDLDSFDCSAIPSLNKQEIFQRRKASHMEILIHVIGAVAPVKPPLAA